MFHTPAIFKKFRFLRKLSFSIFRRYVEFVKLRYTVERRMGVFMLLDKSDKVDLNLLCGGFWEEDRIEYLKELVLKFRQKGQRAVFLDIGSHGALYSVVLNKYVNFDRIIAFEPEPVGVAQITANAMMNDIWDKLEIIQKAVSSSRGVSKFVVAHESNRGQSRLVGSHSHDFENIIDVDVISVDEFLKESNALLIAKIDVEGHEIEVIKGMKNTIRSNYIIIQVEINDFLSDAVEKLLEPLGVRLIHSIGQDYYFIKSQEGPGL